MKTPIQAARLRASAPAASLTRRSSPAAVVLAVASALVCVLLGIGCGDRDRGAPPASAGAGSADASSGGSRDDAPSGADHKMEQKADLWLCPMHPTYIADHKAQCPICGMDLVPAAEFQQAGGASAVPGMALVVLSDDGIRLAGIRTQRARAGALAGTIRAVGLVTPDESRVRRVQTKVEGWIERVHIAAAGQSVGRGDPLVSIYSPELLAGQEELVRTLAARESTPEGEGRTMASELVEAARRRLRLLDVPDPFLDELERTGAVARAVTLRAPFGGVVLERMVYEGQQVAPGMELFTVADLSRVWVEGSFYESEARFLELGLPAELALPYDPTVALNATVDFIYPFVDAETRSIRVRFVVDNDFGLLKPGMYANLTLRYSLGDGVIIPDNAILETGERSIVFVHLGEGKFTPQEIEIGGRSDGEAQILSGLTAGDEVVVRANFLLDSESRIRAALSGTSGAQTPRGSH